MVSKTWERANAIIMVSGVILVLQDFSSLYLVVAAFLSISSYILLHFKQVSHFKPLGGYANMVTAIRFLLLIVLSIFLEVNDLFFAFALVFVLCLDGLDGYLARKFNTKSEVGGHFDMEVDAFFVLVLGIFISEMRVDLWWVLSIGLWRYIYVLALSFLKVKVDQEPVSYAKKTATVLALGSMIWAMFFLNYWSWLALMISALAISFSFLHSLYFQFSKKWIPIP